MYLLWESTVRCWINWQKLFGLCIKGERMSKSRLFATVLIIHAMETEDKETKVQKSLKAAVNPAIIWSSRDFFAGEKCNKPCEYIKKLFFSITNALHSICLYFFPSSPARNSDLHKIRIGHSCQISARYKTPVFFFSHFSFNYSFTYVLVSTDWFEKNLDI